jgi:hypothetical protein
MTRIIEATTRSRKAIASVRRLEAAAPFHSLGEAQTIEAVIRALLDKAGEGERHLHLTLGVVPALVASVTQPVLAQ